MADNVPITAGAGTNVATDDVGGVHYQRAKVTLGTDGVATADLDGSAARGAYVDPRLKVVRLAVTPTISTSPAYSLKDAVGGLMTFTNAVRASGGSGTLQAVQIEDKAQQLAALDLVLFDRSITAPTDNAVFAPSDTELSQCVGHIPFLNADYADLSTNSVATRLGLGLSFVLNGTDLFGVLVARGTPTYASTTDIVVALTIIQD
jgi:hypothetical protein